MQTLRCHLYRLELHELYPEMLCRLLFSVAQSLTETFLDGYLFRAFFASFLERQEHGL